VLCPNCVSRFCTTKPRCGRCGLVVARAEAIATEGEVNPAGTACASCLRKPPAWRAAVCAEDYAFPWNTLIGDFKFRRDVALATLLAERLAAALSQAPGGANVDLVLPIPLSAQRLQQRGFNQAWELARRLARRLGLKAEAHLLQRPVDTAHQVELSLQDRAHNLRFAFMVDPQALPRLAGQRVALVDDVMTTGATVSALATALKQAGVARVDVWVCARA